MIATISVTPSRNLRASTPLLIDGHADGNADINRRVVIRAYAPCLAWKTIFYTGDNSCRPVRPLHLTPSFLLSSSSSISLSLLRSRSCLLTHSRLPSFFFLCQTSFFFMYGFLRWRLSRLRLKLHRVCFIDAETNLCIYKLFYSHVYLSRTN